MIRISIIEFLLSGLIGAVFFRLAWAFTKSTRASWGPVLVIVAVVAILVPASVDGWLVREHGAGFAATLALGPLAVDLLRCAGLLAGASLASIAVAKRKKMGLEDAPRYKDFP